MAVGAGRTADEAAVETTETLINVAATCQATRSLGPGMRAAVWVQGCALKCPGCIAPEWIPIRPARLVTPDELTQEILVNSRLTGITISGGEPMLQAAALAKFVRLVKKERDIDVICFTGFRIEQLRKMPPGPGVEQFLKEIDVLVDGPYIEKLNNNTGLRGSSNQRIIHLTNRLASFELEQSPRQVEIQLADGHVMLVGIPPFGVRDVFNRAIDQANAVWGVQ